MRYIMVFVLQIFLYLIPTMAFLFFYRTKFHIHMDVIITHAQLMFSIALGWVASNILLNSLRNGIPVLSRIATGLWFAITASVYACMATGLSSWGRIPTLEMLKVYIKQMDAALQAVNASLWTALLFLAVFFTVVVFLSWLALINYKALLREKKTNIPEKLHLLLLLVISSSLGIFYKTWFYNIIYTNKKSDPLQLMLFKSSSDMSPNALLVILGEKDNERMVAYENSLRENYQANPVRKPKSVILIIVDALRPDRMGIYGAQRQTTPYLQKMLDQGKAHVVQEARSACSETTCGMLSLLSGKEPQQLLVKNFGLPDILGKLGYKRYFFLSGDHTNFYGARDSYGSHDSYWDGTTNPDFFINDDRGLLKAIEALPQAKENEQYFFSVLFMSVHGLGKKHPEFSKWLPAKSIYNLSLSIDKDLDEYYNYYDNGILQADFMVNKVYNTLHNKGYIDDSSIILLTADHGESLGEHGIRAHAVSVHESGIRIPWIWLGSKPIGNLNDPVIQADFAPTVLSEIGATIPGHWRGLPLQHGTSEREFTFHAQIPFAGVIRYEAANRDKFMFNYKNGARSYFDLKKDPKELEEHHVGDANLEKVLDDTGLSYLGNF